MQRQWPGDGICLVHNQIPPARSLSPIARPPTAGAKRARVAGGRAAAAPAAGKLPTAVVLDIEGTVAPISFVADVLFPYAKARLRSHLEATYDSAETQADLDLLRQQVGVGAGILWGL